MPFLGVCGWGVGGGEEGEEAWARRCGPPESGGEANIDLFQGAVREGSDGLLDARRDRWCKSYGGMFKATEGNSDN